MRLESTTAAVASETPVVVILIGIMGSGKSTFAKNVVARSPASRWVITCQDELGSRDKCESVARAALQRGQSVIVDRMHGGSRRQ